MTVQNPKLSNQNFRVEFGNRIKRFILKLIQFIDSLPSDRTCKIISYQLMDSGTSVGANYFESRAASSKNDFINFLNYSLKSANETKFWLEILMDAQKCNAQEVQSLLSEIGEIANLVASSIITLKGKK